MGFKTRQAARKLVDEVTSAQEKSIGAARKRQEKEESRVRARSQKAQEELIARRQRLAVEAIKDETKRRRAGIEAEYKDERRRIKALLKERLDANEIAARDYQRQLDNFDRDLRTVRDRRLASVPGDVLQSRTNRLLQQFGGGLGARAGGLGAIAGSAKGAALLGGGVVVGGALIKGINEAVAAASSFEDELVEVRKTTGLVDAELDALGDGILGLAQRTGVAQNELAAITAVAGQLGVKGRANLLSFTETVAKFAAVTELSSEQAAEALAKTGRAFDVPVDQLYRLGSAANELSNTTAARAGDIVDALQRVGASGTNIGLAADQVAALAATLIDAGIESERSGTSLRNVFTLLLTEAGKVADTVGVTERAFREMISKDALGAIQLYLEKLSELDAQSRAIAIEDTFGQENTLQITTLATQLDQLNANLATSTEAFERGDSLNREFEASLDSLSAQWAIFTASLTKAATAAGQTVLPALTDILKAVNALAGGQEDAAIASRDAHAEIGRLDDVARAIARYQELADKTERTADEEEELKRITAELAREYPQYVTATDEAGSAVRLYADGIREATRALRELRAEEALRAAQQIGRNLLAANRRVGANRDQRRTLDDVTARAARGEDVGLNGTEDLADARRLNERFRVEAQGQLRDAWEDAAEGYAEAAASGMEAAFERQLRGLGIAEESVAAVRRRAEALGARVSSEATPDEGAPSLPTSGSEKKSGRDREAEEAKRREGRVRQLEEVVVEAEREMGQAGERAQLRVAEAQRERERFALAGYARERAAALDAYAAAESLADLDRRHAEEDAQAAYDAAEAEAQAADSRAEREATLRAASARRDRTLREAGIAHEAALVEAAVERDVALARLDEARAERVREYAEAAASAEADRGRAALDAVAAAMEAEAERAEASGRHGEAAALRHDAAVLAAQVELNAAVAAARDAAEAKVRAAQAAGAEADELDAVRASAERERAAAVAQARIGFSEDVADAQDELDREVAEARLRRLEDFEREVRRVTDVLVGELVTSIAGGDDLARAELDLQKARLLEEQEALDDSLRRRQISREEHAARMAEISQDQAVLEREIQEENAGFLSRSYRALRDVAVSAFQEQASEYVASKLAELLVHTTTEEGKTVATLSGTLARGAALAAETAQSIASAAASVVSAIATQIRQVVSTIPFPFNLGLIPVGVAAVTGAYLGAKKLFFAQGGFVGREGERGRDDVHVVVGRGEAILNGSQQGIVNDALRRTGRPGGLRQVFGEERRPHAYQTGGFAGFAPLLASPTAPPAADRPSAASAIDLSGLEAKMERLARSAERASTAALEAKTKVVTDREASRLRRRQIREDRLRGGR